MRYHAPEVCTKTLSAAANRTQPETKTGNTITRWMRAAMKASPPLAIFSLALLFGGCAATPEIRNVDAPNACMINSIRYKDALAAKASLEEGSHWAEVISVVWDARPSKSRLGHALCFFEYGGSTLVYDPSYGTSILIRGRVEKNPKKLAEHWIMKERIIGRFPWDGEILNVTRYGENPEMEVVQHVTRHEDALPAAPTLSGS